MNQEARYYSDELQKVLREHANYQSIMESRVSRLEQEIKNASQIERERCAKIAEQWSSSIFPIGEDVDYETVMAMLNDIPKNIAEAIRSQDK